MGDKGEAGYAAEPCKISAPYYSSSLAAAEKVWKELAKRGVILMASLPHNGRWHGDIALGRSDVPLNIPAELSCDTLAEVICRAALEWGPRYGAPS